VSWEVCQQTAKVTFEIRVETTGYVGFGLSSGGGMSGSDIVIGGVRPDGIPYFQVNNPLPINTLRILKH
jgi:hypothetical protein